MKEIIKDPVVFLFSLSILALSTSLIGNIGVAIILLVTVLFVFVKDGVALIRPQSIKLLLAFFIVVIVYSLSGHGTLNDVTLTTRLFDAISLVSCFIMSFHIPRFNESQVKTLVGVFIICLLYSVIGTTYVGEINPMALREFGIGEFTGAELEESTMYRSMGMMSYTLAHAMSVISVGLSALICYTPQKWLKVLLLVLLLLIIRLLFVMTITTALLFAIIGCAAIFTSYFTKGKILISIIIVVSSILIVFLAGAITSFLGFAEGNNEEISVKLVDLLNLAKTGSDSGQAGYRQSLYLTSLKTFLGNPLFGWGVDNGSRTVIGEHSYLLDHLAYYGVLSLLFFIAWWKELKSFCSQLSEQLRGSCYLSFIPVVGLVVLKGESVCSMLPFFSLVFLQIVFAYLQNEQKGSKGTISRQ